MCVCVYREGELYKGYERLYASMMDRWTQLTRRHTSVASTISAIKEECSKLEKKLVRRRSWGGKEGLVARGRGWLLEGGG